MGQTLNQRHHYRKRAQNRCFLIGLAAGSAWATSILIGGWLIFLFYPQAYDMLNDSIGLPIDEWFHVTFR